jgi:two-component system response regulator AtoC
MIDSLLIVEDDETLRVTVGEFLAELGYRADTAPDGATALEMARRNSYRLILLDLRLPDMNGLEVLAGIREFDEDVLVVTMTAYPEVRTAVAALKAGAYDYLNKPFDLEDLRELVSRAMETRRLRHEVAWRRAQSDTCLIDDVIGNSASFRTLLDITRKMAAAKRVPVLIRGESGSGKERIAQSIHCLSTRTNGPWVALNCSTLPEGLMESELFGHERGAFTDAKKAKQGLLELADGGTLFLDEIGDLSLALQPKLLRVLEAQRFRRVGGQKEIEVDVRFVAATHRDLPAMVKDGTFREDLYYRLNVGAVNVPPLRERSEDILPLAHHFLAQAAITIGVPQPQLDPRVAPLLCAYSWPGNIRELRNVMERATILSGGECVCPEHLPPELSKKPVASSNAPLSLAEAEIAHIRAILTSCGGNKTHAAEQLEISRQTLRKKLHDAGFPDDEPVSS